MALLQCLITYRKEFKYVFQKVDLFNGTRGEEMDQGWVKPGGEWEISG